MDHLVNLSKKVGPLYDETIGLHQIGRNIKEDLPHSMLYSIEQEMKTLLWGCTKSGALIISDITIPVQRFSSIPNKEGKDLTSWNCFGNYMNS